MAVLLRGSRFGSRLATIFQRSLPHFKTHTPAITWRAYGSTSKKVHQSDYVTGKRTEVDPNRIEEIFQEGRKKASLADDPDDPGYVSHGFSKNPHIDLQTFHLIFFFGVSIVFVVVPFYVHYLPEFNGREWARRQADIVIEERRRKGLPMISADLCEPDKLVLPSPEEEERVWKRFSG